MIMFGEPRRASSDWEFGFVPRAPLCGLHGSDEPAYFALHAFRLASERIGERFDLVADVGVAEHAGRADGEEPDHRNDSGCDDAGAYRQSGNGLESLENKHALGPEAHGLCLVRSLALV